MIPETTTIVVGAAVVWEEEAETLMVVVVIGIDMMMTGAAAGGTVVVVATEKEGAAAWMDTIIVVVGAIDTTIAPRGGDTPHPPLVTTTTTGVYLTWVVEEEARCVSIALLHVVAGDDTGPVADQDPHHRDTDIGTVRRVVIDTMTGIMMVEIGTVCTVTMTTVIVIVGMHFKIQTDPGEGTVVTANQKKALVIIVS